MRRTKFAQVDVHERVIILARLPHTCQRCRAHEESAARPVPELGQMTLLGYNRSSARDR